MNPLAFWLGLFELWLAAWEPPRDLPDDVTDIREAHAIRARRARQGRRL